MVHTPHSSDAEDSQVLSRETLLVVSEAASNMRSNPVKLVDYRTLPAYLKICLQSFPWCCAGERHYLQQSTGLMKHFGTINDPPGRGRCGR